jgi:threonine dehydratase
MPSPPRDLREVPLAAIEAAAGVVRPHVHRTPMLASRTAATAIAARTGVTLGPPGSGSPPRVHLKAEHLQVTGSFKARGVTNRLEHLPGDERRRGVVTLSAGNHAQALAWGGARLGIPVTVVMPEGASRAKAAAAAGYGAEVVLHGTHVGDTWLRVHELQAERGLALVHPFDDPAIIAGQGTVGLEILADLPEVDVIVVGVGGGALLCGIAAAVKQRKPEVRVYGIEPEDSDALSRALGAGSVVDVSPRSIADGLGAPFAGIWTLDLARRYVDAVIRVPDPVIAAGMRFALERTKQLLEPAGATALGALLAGAVPLRPGDVVCAVASGGNVDLDRLPGLLALAD